MKQILTSIAAGALLASLSVAQQRSYRVIDLGTLGGAYSVGFGINDKGEVAGQAATDVQTDGFAATAFHWSKQNGTKPLPMLGPPLFPACPACSSDGAGVGAAGEVAGASEIATLDPNGEDFGQFNPPNPTHRVIRATVWRNGVITALPNLPGGNNANVFWINNAGQISGVAENATYDPSCSMVTPFQVHRFQPVIWGANGKIQKVLSPLVSMGDNVANAFTINDHGQSVGNSGVCSTLGLPPSANPHSTASHAVLWDRDGSAQDLGTLGGAFNGASSINNQGEVVGVAESPTDGTMHTFLWTKRSGMLDYGAYPGAIATVSGCCHTINDRGEIVGFTVEPDNPFFGRALIWQGKQPKDLNDFVRDFGSFVQLTGVSSINNAGEILCQGVTDQGEFHACLAVPNGGEGHDDHAAHAARESAARVHLTDSTREMLRRRLRTPLH